MIDSGASKSIISSKFLSKFQKAFSVKTNDVKLESITGERLLTDGRVYLSIAGIGPQSFIVILTITTDGLIGNDFLTHYKAHIDYDRHVLTIGDRTFNICKATMPETIPRVGKVTELIDVPYWLEGIQEHSFL